jgi:hypothetical protein
MRRVHCRKCFQMTPLLASNCAHCGNADPIRLLKGLGEVLFYVLGGAAAICTIAWIAVVLL